MDEMSELSNPPMTRAQAVITKIAGNLLTARMNPDASDTDKLNALIDAVLLVFTLDALGE